MRIREIKVKFAETIKTREYQNVKPELEMTAELDGSLSQTSIDVAYGDLLREGRRKFEQLKDAARASAGGKYRERSAEWSFPDEDF